MRHTSRILSTRKSQVKCGRPPFHRSVTEIVLESSGYVPGVPPNGNIAQEHCIQRDHVIRMRALCCLLF